MITPSRSCAALSLTLGLAFFATAPSAHGNDSDAVTLPSLQETLRAIWESYDTLEFDCQTFITDADGKRDHSKSYTEYHFVFGSGGRRSLVTHHRLPNGALNPALRNTTSRQDGKSRLMVTLSPGSMDEIETVMLDRQSDSHEDSLLFREGPMNFFTPMGKPLHRLISEATDISQIPSDRAPTLWRITIPSPRTRVSLDLDPAHDWLPVRIENDFSRSECTRFERKNGRWFPAAGVWVRTGEPPELANVEALLKTSTAAFRGFEIENLEINHRVKAQAFATTVPPGTNGVLIFDTSTGKTKVQGGVKRLARGPKTSSQPVEPTDDRPPIRAETDSDANRSLTLLTWGSVSCLAIAAIMLVARLRSA